MLCSATVVLKLLLLPRARCCVSIAHRFSLTAPLFRRMVCENVSAWLGAGTRTCLSSGLSSTASHCAPRATPHTSTSKSCKAPWMVTLPRSRCTTCSVSRCVAYHVVATMDTCVLHVPVPVPVFPVPCPCPCPCPLWPVPVIGPVPALFDCCALHVRQ